MYKIQLENHNGIPHKVSVNLLEPAVFNVANPSPPPSDVRNFSLPAMGAQPQHLDCTVLSATIHLNDAEE